MRAMDRIRHELELHAWIQDLRRHLLSLERSHVHGRGGLCAAGRTGDLTRSGEGGVDVAAEHAEDSTCDACAERGESGRTSVWC